MHAVRVLQKCLSNAFERMHAARAAVLLGAVQALLSGRRLTLMDLARAWPGAERVRAPLKRLDRLLSNTHLQRESGALYGAMARCLVRTARPVIVIDWSELRAGRWHLLRAAVPMGGRTLTLLESIYPDAQKNSPRAERGFLRRLQRLLGPEVQPIIVTDAGFRRPFFRAVRALGWDYVGRLRDRALVQLPGETQWLPSRALYARANARPLRLAGVKLVESAPLPCDLVLYRRPGRGRQRLTLRGSRSLDSASLKAARREREPWLLATSLSAQQFSARQIVAIYAQRMQIEQSFRDLKSERFGCAFRYSLTRSAARLAILLLIHALACFLAWLTAQTLEAHAAATYGGVLSPRPRRHYSLLRLGWEALRHHDPCASPPRLCQSLLLWHSLSAQPPESPA